MKPVLYMLVLFLLLLRASDHLSLSSEQIFLQDSCSLGACFSTALVVLVSTFLDAFLLAAVVGLGARLLGAFL